MHLQDLWSVAQLISLAKFDKRKMLGGTMHQVGALAAAGLQVLKNPDILSEVRLDHTTARLAKTINELDKNGRWALTATQAEWLGTNMIYMHCVDNRVPAE